MNKGQVATTGLIMVAVVSSGLTWLGNYLLSSPAQAQTAIALNSKDIAVLQNFKTNQEQINSEVSNQLKTINDNIVKLLVANHIQPTQ